MPANTPQHSGIALPVILLLLSGAGLLMPCRSEAASLGLNAQLNAQDGKEEEQHKLDQQYSVDFIHQAWLTGMLQMQGAMRYSRTSSDNETNQTVSPAVRLDLTNDLFNLDLNGTASRLIADEDPDSESKGIEATWQSRWPRDLMPGLRLFAGQKNSTSDSIPATTDNIDSHGGAALDWQMSPVRVNYNYQFGETENRATGRESLNTTQTGRIFADRAFFDDRLQLSLSQTASRRSQEDRAPVEGGVALLPVIPLEARSGDDDTPVNGMPPLNEALIDSDKTITAATATPLPSMLNIVVKTSTEQVDRIYIHTRQDVALDAGDISWDLWESRDGIIWTQMVTGAATTYNATEKRFTITTGGIDNDYIKIVANNTGADDIELTEIKLWRAIEATGDMAEASSDQDLFGTAMGMSFAVRPNINLNYNLSYQKSDYSDTVGATTRGMNGGVSWQPSDTVSLSASSAVEERQRENMEKAIARTVGTDAQWQVMPTVDLGLGLSINQNYTGSRQDNQIQQIAASVGAELYRDLSARLNNSFSKSTSYASSADSTSRSTDLQLTSRLLPTLFGSLQTGINTTSGATDDITTTRVSTVLNWRPSDIFGARNFISGNWGGGLNSSAIGFAVDLAPTEKTQLSAGCTYRDTITASTRYILSWRWNISEHLTFLSNGSYTNREGQDDWLVNTLLSASYSVL